MIDCPFTQTSTYCSCSGMGKSDLTHSNSACSDLCKLLEQPCLRQRVEEQENVIC